ncbi:hypothetical protein ABH15_10245 [Methanoculleus taiwanensis]|uniref:DUF4013 domain-containing protein n=2 Tax=Methanoculleus taiwanensis TaxID=1550565 RepID=A0A498H0J7_9EURY|nr:hypothetical protein ABH15_10245 [Methanoculleus taiwanensis]
MDYGNVIGQSIDYAKEGLVGKWGRWIILIVLSLIQIFTLFLVPLYTGYMVRVYGGAKPAPEVDQWGKLFVDGWKLNIIGLIYMIPVLIVLFIFGGFAALSAIASETAGGDPSAAAAAVASLLGGILVAIIVAVIISFIATFGMLRFAHTESFVQAFNFSAILEHIGKIGWGSWIIAVIILFVLSFIYGLIAGILSMIPIIGWIIELFLAVAFSVFMARYFAIVYESEPAPA